MRGGARPIQTTSAPQAQFPEAVRPLLGRLLACARETLAERFVGFYVHGSLATGDFDPRRSDIDFLVAVSDELPEETATTLGSRHAEIAASDLPWATNHEGSYIPLTTLRRHDPDHCRHYAVRIGGSFGRDRHGSEWVIQRHVIREHGVALAGPAPQTLIAPITEDDLKAAVRNLLWEWWMPQLADSRRLSDSEYQAYAVLTMCRALYTLEHGTIVAKPVAADWALRTLPSEWRPLVLSARAWQHGDALQVSESALALVRYTLGVAGGGPDDTLRR
jgi:hypothetical protein